MNHGPHVHVRVGRCDMAVAIEQVRQALPLPAQGLALLPRRRGGLLGLADVAGSAVPFVGLEHWLPLESDTAADTETGTPRLLVLQHGGDLVGVRVDAVLGVKTVPPGAARRVHHVPDADELFESVVPATGSTPMLCILEVARLMRLSQVWCAQADVAVEMREAADLAAAHSQTQQRYAVFAIGPDQWAVPVGPIGQVIPVPPVELALGRSTRSWAVSQWQGRKLPLVDISADRQASSSQDAPWMVLLCQDTQVLGLTVSACQQFVDLAEDALVTTPDDALRAGVAVLPGLGTLQVLDVAKLFRATPEAVISERSAAEASAAAQSAQTSQATEASPYIVFQADQRYASPVAGIVGVVALPQEVQDDLRAGRHAVLPWRGHTLRAINLPSIGRQAAQPDPRLALLVQSPDGAPPLAIAIHSLADWLPAHSVRRSGMRMGSMGELSLVNVAGAPDNASLVVVDLAEMAHLLG